MTISNDTMGTPNPPNSGRFEILLSKYLANNATEAEKAELRWLTENGFGERFQSRIDEFYQTDSGTETLSDQVQREMLSNILGKAPEKVQPLRRWWSLAAAVALVALGSMLWYLVKDNEREQLIGSTTESSQDSKVVLKGKQYLHLPDGSSVLMNEGSTLSYSPELFDKGLRTVELEGEAYFDVKHDPTSVFQVRAGKVVTRVLGTAFNISMKQSQVTVTVTRGLVEVSEDDRVYTKVKPDEQVTINTETSQFQTASLDAEEELSWRSNYLIFDNISINEVQQLIESHYGVDLVFAEPALLNCKITASFLNSEDLGLVLKVLTEMTGATYSIDGKKAIVRGGSCL